MALKGESMPLQFVTYDDSAEFLRHTEFFLLENEAENSLTLGVAAMLSSGSSADNLWASVSDGGKIVGTAFDTPPYKLVVTAAPDDVIDLLASEIHDSVQTTPGVLGPSSPALRFAETWLKLARVTIRHGLSQRIYRLDRVMPPASTSGVLRPATIDDLSLLGRWLEDFTEETGTTSPQTGLQVAELGITEGRMFVWDNGGPMSMAVWARPTRNGVTISAVDTPGNERARGYASACVAALSQQLLDDGKEFCCLYTDLSNRTANDIYLSIGYKPVCDIDDYFFE
jgi:predicted GNAT family acetyltransferase